MIRAFVFRAGGPDTRPSRRASSRLSTGCPSPDSPSLHLSRTLLAACCLAWWNVFLWCRVQRRQPHDRNVFPASTLCPNLSAHPCQTYQQQAPTISRPVDSRITEHGRLLAFERAGRIGYRPRVGAYTRVSSPSTWSRTTPPLSLEGTNPPGVSTIILPPGLGIVK
jgi:hypothetical protein